LQCEFFKQGNAESKVYAKIQTNFNVLKCFVLLSDGGGTRWQNGVRIQHMVTEAREKRHNKQNKLPCRRGKHCKSKSFLSFQTKESPGRSGHRNRGAWGGGGVAENQKKAYQTKIERGGASFIVGQGTKTAVVGKKVGNVKICKSKGKTAVEVDKKRKG